MTETLHKYILNSNYKFSIPRKTLDSDPNLTDHQWIQLFQSLFNKKQLSIYFSQYDSNYINTVMANLIITDLQTIELQYTGHSNIIKSLSFPFFKNLKKLNLGNNNIYSIQFLSYIPAPNLQHISLNDNKLQNLKPLHKNRFDKLKSIDLRQNKIYHLKGIQSLSITELVLENSDYDKVMAYSLRPIFKLSSNDVKIIKMQGFDRIPQLKLQDQLKKRWDKIWVYKRRQNNY